MTQNTIVFNAASEKPLLIHIQENDISTAQVFLGSRKIGYLTHLDAVRKNAAFLYPSPNKADEEALTAFKNAGFSVHVEVLCDS